MRFLSIIKTAENAGPPPQELIEAIGKLASEAMAAGTLVATGGLAPSATGARVRLANDRITVVDGPFTETKELIGGYAMLEAASREEAVESARQLLELHRQHWPGWQGEIEIRQVEGYTPAD